MQRETRRAKAAALRRMQEEGGGVMSIELVFPGDLPRLMQDIQDGDQSALAVVRMTNQVLVRWFEEPWVACFSCGTRMQRSTHKVAAVATVRAMRDDPSMLIGGVICQACAGPDAMDRALAAYRATVDRSAQRIIVHPGAGHA